MAISWPMKASQAMSPRVRTGLPGRAVHQSGGGFAVTGPDGLDGQGGEADPQRLQRKKRFAAGDVEDAGGQNYQSSALSIGPAHVG